ncbi:spherulation-specific family 4 protein [Umezawaea sp. Da 62-37]|uniref:spherulation-specific family 4 protein n=1 Tax=Umezawaea sp. Da 62-37 TaxID=3075927 RepID=UPI0028F6D9A6|nr:spherulation-specific family 4 protein [Umezawaea sp. Da 62-37]WNV87554.1 spherulation-specific family 4 protein [Umezawaea sp. Da 62-37]
MRLSFRTTSGRRFAALATMVATTAVCVTALAVATAAPVPVLGQHVAVPAYISPTDSAAWNRIATSGSQLGFVVANVANGPDSGVNTAWQSVINTTHGSGTKVLGYVDSGYFGFTTPPRETVLGHTDAQSWLQQAEQQIDQWYQFYGASIDGIFIDDGQNVCGPTSGSTTYVDLYRELNDYVHTSHPGALTVVNPGVGVPQCYEDVADVLVTFEGTFANYQNPTGEYVTQPWQLDADPNKFWHLVYDTPQASLTAALDKSKQNNAGYVYVTPDTLSNPWDTVPPSAYWSAELAGTVVTGSTPAAPPKPSVATSDATTVDLSWTSASSSQVVGYDVYQGSVKIGSVVNYTPDATEFTAIGLRPGTQYGFSLKARSPAGKVSAAGPTRTVTTSAPYGAVPSAPGSLTATELAPTSLKLGWTASTGTVDHYDVYQGATRILTVKPTVTSARVGFLTPSQQYSFKVVARRDSGVSSAASNTVTVTAPAPSGGPVASPTVDMTTPNTTLQAQYNLPFTFRNVFVDSDSNAATGYPVAGIGADHLIQGENFYQHAGGTGFSWNTVSGVAPLISHVGGLYVWRVPTSTFGTSTGLKVVFNGSGGSPDAYTAIVTAVKH